MKKNDGDDCGSGDGSGHDRDLAVRKIKKC